MTVRVGINGFGRIGRSFERVLLGQDPPVGIEVVAVNEPNADSETLAFLLEHVSVGGVLGIDVGATEHGLKVDGHESRSLDASNPARSRGRTMTSRSSSKPSGTSAHALLPRVTLMRERVESWFPRPAGAWT